VTSTSCHQKGTEKRKLAVKLKLT